MMEPYAGQMSTSNIICRRLDDATTVCRQAQTKGCVGWGPEFHQHGQNSIVHLFTAEEWSGNFIRIKSNDRRF